MIVTEVSMSSRHLSGLKAGDVVVLEGLVGLKDSIQIAPKQASADSVYTNL